MAGEKVPSLESSNALGDDLEARLPGILVEHLRADAVLNAHHDGMLNGLKTDGRGESSAQKEATTQVHIWYNVDNLII